MNISHFDDRSLAVSRVEIDYVKPLRLSHAPLFVAVWVTQVHEVSFTLGYELYSASSLGEPTVHARAITDYVPAERTDIRHPPLTREERDRLGLGIEAPPIVATTEPKPAGQSRHDADQRPVRVRLTDVDASGKVNNVRYVDYVQDAQSEYMIGVFVEAAIDTCTDLVVAHTELEYIAPMYHLVEPYDVSTRVAALGTTSVTFEVEIHDADRLLARGRVVSVNMEPRNAGYAVPIHVHHRAVYEARMGGGAST